MFTQFHFCPQGMPESTKTKVPNSSFKLAGLDDGDCLANI